MGDVGLWPHGRFYSHVCGRSERSKLARPRCSRRSVPISRSTKGCDSGTYGTVEYLCNRAMAGLTRSGISPNYPGVRADPARADIVHPVRAAVRARYSTLVTYGALPDRADSTG